MIHELSMQVGLKNSSVLSVNTGGVVGGVVAEWLARSTRVRKDTGSNPAGAGHYVTTVTVGKLFTPTVPSRAEARLNQLAPGTAVPL